MKRSIISMPFIAACIIGFFTMSSFKTIPSASASKAEAITIFATSPTAIGTTFSGPVTLSGAFDAKGSYEMPTKQIGMALHCLMVISIPQKGTITIRLNCNLVTFNGVWKILEGTGAYQNLTGGGSLVMPNDTDEVLTGTVRGL